jgi:alkylation response protein AidB-like acyl-CoA dehydrogenase
MSLSADQVAIRDAAHGFLVANATFEHVRRALTEPEGWSRDLWSRFGVDLGFAGLAVPTSQGGSGLGLAELALVAEELGASLPPIPWFESAVLSALTLQTIGATAQQRDIAAGRVMTLAIRDELGRPLPLGIGPEIRGGAIEGEAHFVPFGHVAEQLIVAARENNGISLFAIAADTPGVEIIPKVTLDPTRPMASIRFARADIASTRLGAPGQSEDALVRALGLSGAVLAAEQVGGMRRTLAELVAYAKQRVQFGRAIGSFQALKHRMADMKVLLEGARSALAWAIEAALTDDPSAILACAGARAYCSDAYLKIAAEGIQLHGGIGFTWEHHAHLFFKRARSSSTLLDPPEHHRERIARAIVDAPDPDI